MVLHSWATNVLQLLDQLYKQHWLEFGYTQSTVEEQFVTMVSLGTADVSYKFELHSSCSYCAVIKK
jgi:hypothetical protein